MDKLKAFFKKYGVEILEAYLAGMACYICMYTASWNIWMTAVVIGLINSYLKTPVVNALRIGNADKEEIFGIKHLVVLKNILESLGICSILFVVFYLVDTYLFTTVVEPISFGIMYEVLHIVVSKLIKKCK